MKIFKDNMEVIIKTVDTNKLPGFKRLLTEEYWKISDDQFDGIIEEVIKDVSAGKVRPIDIVKLFVYFSYFIKKDLIKYDIQTIKRIFINGLNISAQTAEYCPNVEEELDSISVKDTDNEIEEILISFANINEKLRDKMYRKIADDLFKYIPMKMEMFYDKFAKECMNVPIFKYYEPFQMFQRISCASNEDIVTIKEMLEDRAKKHTKEIEPEIDNMIKLKQIVHDYIDGKQSSIKIVILEDFEKGLDNILELYN